MPKYYGCPCEGCGKPLTLQDDIVVCPDCGAPYHRTCYEKMGLCIHAPAHGAGYEWKFPYQDAQLRTCPTCGERTLRSENVCRCCGAALPPESAEQPNDRAAASAEQNRDFDYSRMYRDEMYRNFTEKVVDPVHRNVRAAFGKDELRHSKISMSFSALLFGPFYFFYRKAWKPAFGFLAAELLLFIPTLISMMQTTGSPLTAGISASTLVVLSRVMSLLSFALMLVRGLYGKWLYRRSAAARIRRIRAEFPDPEQRRAVLNAQGGVSFAACIGAFILLMLVGSLCSMLLGPDLNALVGTFI